MTDIAGPVLTAGAAALIAGIVQVYGMLQDRRHTKSQDTRADAKAPFVQRSMDLSNIDQYTVIQQRMIDSQTEEIQSMTAKLMAALAENKLLRDQMLDMFLHIREMERRNGSSGTAPYNVGSDED